MNRNAYTDKIKSLRIILKNSDCVTLVLNNPIIYSSPNIQKPTVNPKSWLSNNGIDLEILIRNIWDIIFYFSHQSFKNWINILNMFWNNQWTLYSDLFFFYTLNFFVYLSCSIYNIHSSGFINYCFKNYRIALWKLHLSLRTLNDIY